MDHKKYYYLFVFGFFLILLINNNQAYTFPIKKFFFKKKIHLIHADFIQKNEKSHNDIFDLTGHVHLEHHGYHLFCDKAIYYKKNNQFYGYGNVQLVSNQNRIYSQKIEFSKNFLKVSKNVILFQDNIKKLTANAIIYSFIKKSFQATKNVILFINNKLKLSTHILEYDLKLKKIFYKKGGWIFYGNSTIIYSKEGSYFLTKKKAELKHEIKLVSNNYTVYSNTMKYFFQLDKLDFLSPTIVIHNNNQSSNSFLYLKEGSFLFRKKIFLSKKNFSIHYKGKIIKGGYLFFDHKKKYGFIKNVFFEDPKIGYLMGVYGIFDLNSGLFSLKKDSTAVKKISNQDSIIIHSDTIQISLLKKSTTLIQAFPVKNIFFMNGVMQGKCDFLVYEQSNNNSSIIHSSMLLNGNPIFWINNNQQFTGDSISISMKNNMIDSLSIKNVFFIKKINSEKFHQIKGENMTGFFNHEKKNIEKILIKGNAKSIIFLYDTTQNLINKSSCGIILLELKKEGKEISKISCIDKAYSELFPFSSKNIYKKNLFFPKFFWREREEKEIQSKKNSVLKQIEKYKEESFLEQKERKKIKKN
ncbi:OstA-like protein [Blattabacterium cuenoti]|uniref:OstA-like protein n=1 Tax=Blattabacterium cuenoti TaxID=1653831 RepID=UPI00163C7B01|nr:OstA-like protein [Blattabacterium cuenoti]